MTALAQSSKPFDDGVKETFILLALAFQPAIKASGYATTEKLKELTDLLRSYTTEQLLALKANRVPGSENFLVAEREIQRRKQLDQQEGSPKSASLTAQLRHKPT